MTNNRQDMTMSAYDRQTHRMGKWWIWGMGLLLILYPLVVCVYYGAWPDWSGFLQGFLAIAPMYWTVGLIEDITYIPMLGAGGSYLGFVTGSLTMLKVPCTLAALDRAEVRSGTEEGEAVATIAVAVSSLTALAIITLGVLLMVPLTPILEHPVLKPAFDHLLPALFGGLGVALIAQNWKVAVAPMAVMMATFIAFPALSKSGAIFVPVAALIAIGAARFMYRKGILK